VTSFEDSDEFDAGWDEPEWDDPDYGEGEDLEEPTIDCPYCGAEIHEDAQRCPRCEQ